MIDNSLREKTFPTYIDFSIARPACVHYNHCVSPSVRPWSVSKKC